MSIKSATAQSLSAYLQGIHNNNTKGIENPECFPGDKNHIVVDQLT